MGARALFKEKSLNLGLFHVFCIFQLKCIMRTAKAATSGSILQNLPSVDELLQQRSARSISNDAGAAHAAELVRSAIAKVRQRLQESGFGWRRARAFMPRASKHRPRNILGKYGHLNGPPPFSELSMRPALLSTQIGSGTAVGQRTKGDR
jgi:hypothetical protein